MFRKIDMNDQLVRQRLQQNQSLDAVLYIYLPTLRELYEREIALVTEYVLVFEDGYRARCTIDFWEAYRETERALEATADLLNHAGKTAIRIKLEQVRMANLIIRKAQVEDRMSDT